MKVVDRSVDPWNSENPSIRFNSHQANSIFADMKMPYTVVSPIRSSTNG